MTVLVILQGPAYGTEASYNGLRLAGSPATRDGVEVRIFRVGDSVGSAVAARVGTSLTVPAVTGRRPRHCTG